METGGLGVHLTALLGELQRELDLALVSVAHDLVVVRQAGDRVAVMRHGRIVESGPADEVYDTPSDPCAGQPPAAVPAALDPRAAAHRRPARRASANTGRGPAGAWRNITD